MVTKNKHMDIQFSEDTRLALLEQSIGHLNVTLERFEKRFDQIDAKFDLIDIKFNHIDGKFDRMDAKFEKLDSRIDSNFKWLLSVMIAGFGSLLGIIAHTQHWI